MGKAEFRFYAELNDFLWPELRGRSFVYEFSNQPTVKDAIEALGVPHVEVELIIANGESVDFSYRLCDGDRIAVYPVFESLDITELLRIRRAPLRQLAFACDAHLGKLARLLRLLGFDTLHNPKITDAELISLARAGRVILTRDRQLLKHGELTHGYWVRSVVPLEQAQEVLRRFDLWGRIAPFTRCLACNGLLQRISKEEALPRVPPKVRAWCEEFLRCSQCQRIFWPGTHYPKLQDWIQRILGEGT
ncbi:MAG: Mut7-C ubiquitin/RNAse domain-containing protein [Candidatus Bipolaricaulota bacterium]|nr:Mut7-C ubiquitin/RNAse domain-containing protein [Candidatus Bipolaricaulota bacterium]MDW8126897.1 Mut7-C RNAse domain-containing protein [Candidatus Bipolaricaulota bacterium]